MKRVIKLFCAGGMSTSLLVNKMKEAAKEQGKEYDIKAHSVASFEKYVDEADVCLIGPQIRYTLQKLRRAHPQAKITDIPMQMYGLMDGKGILKEAEKMMQE